MTFLRILWIFSTFLRNLIFEKFLRVWTLLGSRSPKMHRYLVAEPYGQFAQLAWNIAIIFIRILVNFVKGPYSAWDVPDNDSLCMGPYVTIPHTLYCVPTHSIPFQPLFKKWFFRPLWVTNCCAFVNDVRSTPAWTTYKKVEDLMSNAGAIFEFSANLRYRLRNS